MTEENELRVWWSSQIPIPKSGYERYLVETIREAKIKIKTLAQRDLNDKLVTDNVGGLEVFENEEWSEWYCDDCGEDIFICKCKEKK